jgi:hypothetical protein
MTQSFSYLFKGMPIVHGVVTSRGDIDLPPLEPEVSTSSSPKELSLAKHLRSIGAKMYGAFWCSHCFEQKQMFGKEAMKYVEYVECFPEGYRKGVQIAKACEAANIQGFPTWIINGQVSTSFFSLLCMSALWDYTVKPLPEHTGFSTFLCERGLSDMVMMDHCWFQQFSGEQELSQLAEASGFDASKVAN